MNPIGSQTKITSVFFNLFYFILAAALFAYVLVRGNNLSFTHDESLTYTILKGNDKWLLTANNHWLNTGLAYVFSGAFGFSEIVLRMPNVLALVIYLFYGYRFLNRYAPGWPGVVVFVSMALLNPFALDFFSLARGYGLALAFLLASMYHFVAALRQEKGTHLFWFTVFSLLCIYANYSFLTAVLANYIGYFVCKLAGKVKLGFYSAGNQPGSGPEPTADLTRNATGYALKFRLPNNLRAWFRLFPVKELVAYGAIALGVVPAILNTLELSKRNELYFGGETGVLSDTINSILVSSFYGSQLQHFTALVSGIFILLVVAGLFTRKKIETWFLLVVILALVIIPEILHSLIGMKFAIERSALYWIPVCGVYLLLFSDEIWARKSLILKVPVMVLLLVLSLGSIQNFIKSINFTHTFTWAFDANTRSAMKEIAAVADKTEPQKLAVNWLFEPALNYYRELYGYSWLEPVTRNEPDGSYDLYYITSSNLEQLKATCLEEVKTFPETDSKVMKRCRAN